MKRSVKSVLAAVSAAVVLTGCEFSVYDVPMPGGADTGPDPLTVEVEFADVLDLVPQSTVKVDDIDVGKVQEVELERGVAVVTVELRRDTELPANAVARIGQSSLLGEKYVELDAPLSAPASTPLADGDRIPLARSGRNPEIEEVLGALSLILNGGGVSQLKTITTELNAALGGREDSARSVLHQVELLMSNLDAHKNDITTALQRLTRLSEELQDQRATINATLDELPSALSSIDKQREDLVTMLGALEDLSTTGVEVINATHDDTVSIVRDLNPILSQLSKASGDLVYVWNLAFTFPFVDESVGTTAQQARSLHMGDYVNLDVNLNLDLSDLVNNPPVIPALPDCKSLGELGSNLSLDELLSDEDLLGQLCQGAIDNLNQCTEAINNLDPARPRVPRECLSLPIDVTVGIIRDLLENPEDIVPGVLDDLDGVVGGLLGQEGLVGGLLGANRAPVGSAPEGTSTVSMRQLAEHYDPALVQLMTPGLATTSGGTR